MMNVVSCPSTSMKARLEDFTTICVQVHPGQQIASILKRRNTFVRPGQMWSSFCVRRPLFCPEVHDGCESTMCISTWTGWKYQCLFSLGHPLMRQVLALYQETTTRAAIYLLRFTRQILGLFQDASSPKPRSPLRGKVMRALSHQPVQELSPGSSTKPSDCARGRMEGSFQKPARRFFITTANCRDRCFDKPIPTFSFTAYVLLHALTEKAIQAKDRRTRKPSRIVF